MALSRSVLSELLDAFRPLRRLDPLMDGGRRAAKHATWTRSFDIDRLSQVTLG